MVRLDAEVNFIEGCGNPILILSVLVVSLVSLVILLPFPVIMVMLLSLSLCPQLGSLFPLCLQSMLIPGPGQLLCP